MPTVVLDTDFLSSFLKTGRCDLIRLLYQIEQATIPTALHRELAQTTVAAALGDSLDHRRDSGPVS